MASCRNEEGWGPASNLRWDLTPCFEEGVLLAAVNVAFIAVASWRIWVLSCANPMERTTHSQRLLKAKLVLSVLAALASVANLALAFKFPVPVPTSYILEALALTLAPVLAYLTHTRTRTSSTSLLLFWPLYLCGVFLWGRTLVYTGLGPLLVIFALRCALVGLGLAAFVLEYAGPERATDLRRASEHGPLESEYAIANMYQRWTFSWLTALMRKGAKEYITEEDLAALLPKDESAKLGEELKMSLKKHKSLWKALFAAYGGPYLIAAVLKVAQDALAFLQPQLLRWLLVYISAYQRARNNDQEPPNVFQGFAITAIMFVASIAQTFILHQYFQRCFETGMRVRAGLITVIYQKALRLGNDERSRSSGDVVNLQSVDTTRLQDFCTYGLIAISGPFQVTLAFVSLYQLLGWSAFVGVAIMIISIPLNAFVANVLKKMSQKQMKNRDERTRLMSELLANIRSIKLHAWENAFMRRILSVRNDQELKLLRKIGVTNALSTTLWTGVPMLVAFGSFATAAATSSTPLTSDIIFPAISLFMLLQFPLAMFAMVTSNIVESIVSLKRISDFLKADELQADAREVVEQPLLKLGDEVLSVRDGEFCWSKEASQPTLEGIDITVRKGELFGIWGRVGAGKTSLLSAICGDMIRVEGQVKISGSVAYAPQTPWIMSATLRDNIIFSHTYDETFYNLVLDACALRPDLELLGKGDLTIVGEKGITLSGGQRARVSLARAVYARADLTLLDDTLAALDSHVGRHVFDNVIGPNGILATKARILVTHSVAFVKQFDQVAFVRRGIILDSGSPEEVLANKESELSKLLHGHGGSMSSSGISTPNVVDDEDTLAVPSPISSESGTQSEEEKVKILGERERRKSYGKAMLVGDALPVGPSEGITKEHSEQGRVKTDVYAEYIKAASGAGFAIFLLTSVLMQASVLASNLTLRAWGEHNADAGANSSMGRYLLAYGAFSAASALCGAVSSIVIWVLCALRSARYLHDGMLNAVLRAPLAYFEATPTGRTLNLFSRDMYVVDSVLARVIQGLVRTVCICLGIVFVIGGAFPMFLLAVVPLAWFYWSVMQYYLATSRELKRLDAVSRSPIFAWFSESLAGLTTIRAFGQQKVFMTANSARIDHNSQAYLPSVSVNRWLAVRLELVGALIILASSTLALTALITTGVDAGLVGLVLSYALNTTGSLNWVVRSASELETNITSVERIMHLTRIPSEAPAEIPDTKPAGAWPARGEIEFRDYSMRYRPELDLVLRNISFTVKAGEKLGIVGRTGSGKSSTLLSLFRVIEPAGGTILIDGVDTTTLGLHDLRSSISIVPQSPELFEGTLRQNVDPAEEHQDVDIWEALSQCHMREYVESLEGGLDAPVKEGGSSMSSGQRQLLCFARAMLRKSKILVLDEATSACDLETDRYIQDIIRHLDCTLLTIAHRLNTIIDYDRVLVLDAGKVVELDSPANLLENKESAFRSLAVEAGLA